MVPPTGFTAQLTLFSAAAMAFLAVFALGAGAGHGAAGGTLVELAQTVTVRVSPLPIRSPPRPMR